MARDREHRAPTQNQTGPMRSSKQRSRNKQNRNARPSGGNVINRVFDSSGPEGKVRGTPAQIIEKYQQLHRDAQLSGDRVNAENFAQHSEHYTRMLAEATREVDRAREEQEAFARERQTERDRQMEGQRDRDRERAARLRAQEEAAGEAQGDRQPERQQDRQQDRQPERQPAPQFRAAPEPRGHDLADASFLSQPLFSVPLAEDDAPGGLVDTPEERRSEAATPRAERPRREERRPWRDERRPEAEAPAPQDEAAVQVPGPVAAEEPRADRPRRARKPRAPREGAVAPATDAAE